MDKQIEKRLKEYKGILAREPVLLKTLESTLRKNNQDFLDIYDLIFLHVFAPVLLMFTNAVLIKAIEDKASRIHFLARDGYLFNLSANVLKKAFDYPLDVDYVYVSRLALRKGEYYLLGKDCIDLLCKGALKVTPLSIIMRTGCTGDEALDYLRSTPYGECMDEPLLRSDLIEFKEYLTNKAYSGLAELIDKYGKKEYENAREYLKAKGIRSEETAYICDSGWIGTIAGSLSRISKAIIKGYYFGLFENESDSCPYCWYFRPRSDMRKKIYFANSLFEGVCSAPEGMTIGYKNGNPVIDKVNPNSKRQKRNEELILAFTEAFVEEKGNLTVPDNKDIAYSLFKRLMASPKGFEVRELGDIAFCDDVIEEIYMPIAGEIEKKFFTGPVSRKSAWPKGSIRLYGTRTMALMEDIYGYAREIKRGIS